MGAELIVPAAAVVGVHVCRLAEAGLCHGWSAAASKGLCSHNLVGIAGRF
jgi:hypothetical protein